jgi:hypothetical protein
MQNGCQFIQNYVHGVKKQFKEAQVVTSWLVYVVKVSVIYVQNLGNLTTRTTSSVTYTKKVHSKM